MKQSTPKYFEIDFCSDLRGNILGESDRDTFAISTCAKVAGPIRLAAQGRSWDQVVSVIDGAMICRDDVVDVIQNSGINIGRGNPHQVDFASLEGRIAKGDFQKQPFSTPILCWIGKAEVQSFTFSFERPPLF